MHAGRRSFGPVVPSFSYSRAHQTTVLKKRERNCRLGPGWWREGSKNAITGTVICGTKFKTETRASGDSVLGFLPARAIRKGKDKERDLEEHVSRPNPSFFIFFFFHRRLRQKKKKKQADLSWETIAPRRFFPSFSYARANEEGKPRQQVATQQWINPVVATAARSMVSIDQSRSMIDEFLSFLLVATHGSEDIT